MSMGVVELGFPLVTLSDVAQVVGVAQVTCASFVNTLAHWIWSKAVSISGNGYLFFFFTVILLSGL